MNPQVDSDGNRMWFRRGLLHREGGPAIERADGTKAWFRDGLLHRDGGPAARSGGPMTSDFG